MPYVRRPRPWEHVSQSPTPEKVYWKRREVLRALGLGTLTPVLPVTLFGCGRSKAEELTGLLEPAVGKKYKELFPAKRNDEYKLGGDRKLTEEAVAARYNNFYEFTTYKQMVWKLARGFPVDPWKVEVGGLVKKPRTLDLDDIFKRFPLEERLYRFRCVEAWAMQVPWTGYPLKLLIDNLEPLAKARYVRFVTFLNSDRAVGQQNNAYPWPYFEALRMDEATNELAMIGVGIYGHAFPMQHGAPCRVITPWKYGYKSIKSIVRIEFTDKRPPTFWNQLLPREYGFYSNINPRKPHPRWSQAMETDIGSGERRPTLLYGGYGEQVASLYTGKEF